MEIDKKIDQLINEIRIITANQEQKLKARFVSIDISLTVIAIAVVFIAAVIGRRFGVF